MNSNNIIQVHPEHYLRTEYDKKNRFIGYWHQINEIIQLKAKSVLEVGIGNGFVSDYLKNRGYRVITMDVDERLGPDLTGSVLELPFDNNSIDAIACYEVLEHIPYEDFKTALSEIHRVTSSSAVISLPDIERVFRLVVDTPVLGEIKKLVIIPRIKKPVHEFDGEHYWEIGKKGYSLQIIINDIEKSGFSIKSTYRIFENPRHRFFILEK